MVDAMRYRFSGEIPQFIFVILKFAVDTGITINYQHIFSLLLRDFLC